MADRQQAIAYAIEQMNASDWLVIAGKGHETEQIVGDDRLVFDDRKVALACLDLVKT